MCTRLPLQAPTRTPGAQGDLDVNGVNLTIANASGGNIAIDGQAADRVFDVGPLSAAQVTLNGVTVQNGKPGTTAPGGGISVGSGSTLALNNDVVANKPVAPRRAARARWRRHL